MGRIVRCADNGIVSHPLYAAVAGIHLYSLEELSYFLQHFIYLIHDEFFDSELIRFLREETKRPDLADLVERKAAQMDPVVLAAELAAAIGDMNHEEKERLNQTILTYQKMSRSGRKRLQADMLMKRGEYDQAEQIYLSLLREYHQDDAQITGRNQLSEEEAGRIYYCMGKIHMAAFEWKAAGEALVKSYEILQQESILHELYELTCISPVEVCDWQIFSDVHKITIRRWQELFAQKKARIEKEVEEENRSDAEKVCRQWKRDFRKIRKSC